MVQCLGLQTRGFWVVLSVLWAGCFPGALDRDADGDDTLFGDADGDTGSEVGPEVDGMGPDTDLGDSDTSDTADTETGDTDTTDTEVADTDTGDTDANETDSGDTDTGDTVTLNACGGLGALSPGEPGASCGPCDDGELVCDPSDAEKNRTRCEGDSALNACQGCGVVAPALGTECGECGLVVCDGVGGTRCAEPIAGCEVPLTCEELACGAQQRSCVEGEGDSDASCGACLPTYEEVGGECRGQVVAPVGVTATVDLEDRVLVSWGAVTHATGYRLYRCVGDCGEAGPWVELLPVAIAQTSFPDQTAAAPAAPPAPNVSATVNRPDEVQVTWAAVVAPQSPRYSYRVVAVGPTGESAPSSVAMGWLAERPLTGYELSVAGGAWQPVEGTVFVDPEAARPSLVVGAASASQGVFADKVVVSLATWSSQDGASREYRVRAKTRFGVGAIGTASGRRQAGAVTLTWERSAASAPADFAAIAGSAGPVQTARNYEDTDAAGIPPNGVVRYYRARLAAAGATEVVSEPASGWRLPAPGVPQLQSVTTELEDRVELRWAPVDGALGYHVYRLGTRITPSQGAACTSSPCVYADLGAPAAGAWGAPTGVSATTNQTTGVTVTWTLPGRPKGARQVYEVSAINPAGESAKSPQVDGWRSGPALTGLEVKATVSGADTTHFVAADATSYNHTAAPLATFAATTLSATQGAHRNEVRVTLTGGTLVSAATVGYQVRGQLPGGNTPWSTTVSGRRATGSVSRAWEYANPANPTVFATLSTQACPASSTSCNDTSASALGAKRIYRATLSAAGATSLTTHTMEGWRLAFTFVDAGSEAMCAIDSTGRLWSWSGPSNLPFVRAQGPYVECSTGGIHGVGDGFIPVGLGCGRSATGDVDCGRLHEDLPLTRRTDLGTGVKSLQLGLFHACAVRSNGQAVCWGENDFGGLGNNTNVDSETPVTVVRSNGVALGSLVNVTTGNYNSCAQTTTKTVWCWGVNHQGQLGDDTTTPRPYAVQVPNLSNVTGLGSGAGLLFDHTCVLLGTGEVRCFGGNLDGQLGDGTMTNSSVPVSVLTSPGQALGGVQQIVTLGTSTCARRGADVRCWGADGNGALGNGEPKTDSAWPVTVSLPAAPSAIGGRYVSVYAIVDGGLWCWGSCANGGDGSGVEQSSPALVPLP